MLGHDATVTRSEQPKTQDASSFGLWAGGLVSEPTSSDAHLLYGLFTANEAGVARDFFEGLKRNLARATLRNNDAEQILVDAVHQCQPSLKAAKGIAGCASVIQGKSLAYIAIGRGVVAVERYVRQRLQTEVLAAPIDQSSNVGLEEPAKLADFYSHGKEAAFGSLIAVSRDSLNDCASPELQSGSLPLYGGDLYLVLGVHPHDGEAVPDSVRERITRSMRQDGPTEVGAFRTMGISALPDSRYCIASCQLSSRQHMTSPSEENASLRQGKDSNHADRHVSFVEVPTIDNPFEQHAQYPSYGSFRDQTGTRSASHLEAAEDLGKRFSNIRHLGEPDMTIPEDNTLPSGSAAGQLPPPLLAPIRKAYPSGEWIITPEMLGSPSPVRKAMIGRAASFNSPAGLWMPDILKQQESPSRSWHLKGRTSLGLHASLDHRNPTEGLANERVRGGLPRPSSSSYLSQLSRLSQSSRASPSESPEHSADILSMSLQNSAFKAQSPAKRDTDGGAQEPWNAPVSPAGRKMRGRSTALRMLRSNDENRAPNENKDSSNFANSAPAKLLSSAKSDRDSAEYKDRMSASAGSSHTEHSLTSNDGLSRTTSFASSGGSRTVNCLPPLPELASSGTPQKTLPILFPRASDTSRRGSNSRLFLDDEGENFTRQKGLYQAFVQHGTDKSVVMQSGRSRGGGMADSAGDDSLEGRQHSGMAFSPSPDLHLADSVRSLTLAEG